MVELATLILTLGVLVLVHGILRVDTTEIRDFRPGALQFMTPAEKEARKQAFWNNIMKAQGLDKAIICAGLVMTLLGATIVTVLAVFD